MPTQYDGLAGNITPPARLTLSTVVLVTGQPFEVTTTAAHGLVTGDLVDIFNCSIYTPVNGVWTVTRVNTTAVTLNNTTSFTTTTYAGPSGFVQPLTFGATYALASDGDPRSAASMNVALEALGDRTSFLLANTGEFKTAGRVVVTHDDSGAGNSWSICTIGAVNTWTAFDTGFNEIIVSATTSDVLEVSLDTTWHLGTTTTILWLALYVGQKVPGGSYTYTRMAGSGKLHYEPTGADAFIPVTLRGTVALSGLTSPILSVLPYAFAPTVGGTTGTTSLVGDYTMHAQLLRATGIPQ